MKKKIIPLLLAVISLSIAGCGSKNEIHISEEAVPISSVVKASAAEAAPVIEEVTKEEEEEAVFAEPNYCKDKNLEVKEFSNFEREFLFYAYNKDDTGTIVSDDIGTFPAPTKFYKNVDDLGDGNKRVAYSFDIDLKAWPIEYNYFNYEFYIVDTVTGDIYKDGESNFREDHIYGDNYESDLLTMQITVPSDYEDYALFVREVSYDAEMILSADNLVAIPVMEGQDWFLVH